MTEPTPSQVLALLEAPAKWLYLSPEQRTVIAGYVREVERLRGLLKQAEWAPDGHCPWCEAWHPLGAKSKGHAATCQAFPPNGQTV
jgi:hypothetical protein